MGAKKTNKLLFYTLCIVITIQCFTTQPFYWINGGDDNYSYCEYFPPNIICSKMMWLQHQKYLQLCGFQHSSIRQHSRDNRNTVLAGWRRGRRGTSRRSPNPPRSCRTCLKKVLEWEAFRLDYSLVLLTAVAGVCSWGRNRTVQLYVP